jgi:hypothetical protein
MKLLEGSAHFKVEMSEMAAKLKVKVQRFNTELSDDMAEIER